MSDDQQASSEYRCARQVSAIFVHAARGERAFVMDPLGRGRYQGEWVPKADLRQYASRFTTSSGSPYCAVVKRGEQSRIEQARRTTRERALVQARDAVEALRRTA